MSREAPYRTSRRGFVAGLAAALAAPVSVTAQQAGKVYRIGWLGLSPTPPSSLVRAFVETLRANGFVEGKNVVIERRYAQGNADRIAQVAAELVQLKVDVIVATHSTGAVGARQATATIPIVMVGGNPERVGLVTNLARPGGNVTGISNVALEWSGKALQTLKDALPDRSRVAILWNPDFPASVLSLRQEDIPTASALRMVAIPIELRTAADLPRGFDTIVRERADVIYAHLPMWAHRQPVQEFADKRRLPVVCGTRDWTEMGALLSYGPDTADLFVRAASYVARILNGAKPGDLPIEQASKFELVINAKVAKALGVTIPPSVLLRADHVFE